MLYPAELRGRASFGDNAFLDGLEGVAMRKGLAAGAFALLMVTACGKTGPLSTMEPGERGRVVRIIDGDALVLDTGQSVRLVGLEAPAMNWRDNDRSGNDMIEASFPTLGTRQQRPWTHLPHHENRCPLHARLPK